MDVDTVIDLRAQKLHFIGVYETTRYFFIPVDRYVSVKQPLSVEIQNLFAYPGEQSHNKRFSLTLQEFEVLTQSQFFQKKYLTRTLIGVYTTDRQGHSEHLGNLLYDVSVSGKRPIKDGSSGFVASLDSWKRLFSADMLKLAHCPQEEEYCRLPNFFAPQQPIAHNIIANAEASVWKNTLLVDGELVFSRMENQRRFHRKTYGIRYRHESKFQSFEWSLANDQLNYRFSKHFMLTLKSRLFMGINRWNEEEFRQRNFLDIFIFDYSLGQQIVFNPFLKRGVVGGIGVMGDVSYIYSEGLSIIPLLTVHLGLKL